MSSGETVPRSVPTPSPGSAVMSELGLGAATLLALAAGGAELLPDADGDEELEKAAFPEAARPPTTTVELGRIAWLGTHGAWGAGEVEQADVIVVVATLVVVASAASGWLCPGVEAAWIAPPD
jgi:hypothetical protein